MRSEIVYVHHLFCSGNQTEATFRVWPPHLRLLQVSERRRNVVERDSSNEVSLVKNHGAEFRPADTRGVLQHLLEYRLQLAGRGTDDLKNLRGRRLLLQRLGQFRGPLLDLVLQIGIGFLKPCTHVIELVGETLEFVAGPNRDAL